MRIARATQFIGGSVHHSFCIADLQAILEPRGMIELPGWGG